MTESTLLITAAIGYLIASAAYGAHLFLREQILAVTGRLSALAAVVLHTVAIGLHCIQTHQTPLTTPSDSLSASAWAIALAYLALEFLRKPPLNALGAVALPASFLCLFAGAFLRPIGPSKAASLPLLNSNLISLHILAILFAFGLLVLAFGCAALYLLQHRMLKRKRVHGGLFGKLPPLSSLDELAFTLVAFAFPLLTVGLAAGFVKALAGGMPGAWGADPIVWTSVVTWLVYGLYLALHAMAHWRGPRANYLLLGGLAAALMTYIIPTSHRFG